MTPGMYVYLSDFERFEPTVPPRLSPRLLIKMKLLLLETTPVLTKETAELF